MLRSVHRELRNMSGGSERRKLGKLHKTVDLVADIKRGSLEWLGHVIKIGSKTGQ
jgi:hypothetical protein